MDDDDDDYKPRSPDLSALSSYHPQQAYHDPAYSPSHLGHDLFSLPQSSYHQTSYMQQQQPASTFTPGFYAPPQAADDAFAHIKTDTPDSGWPSLQPSDAPAPAPSAPPTSSKPRKMSAKQQQAAAAQPRPPAPGDEENIVIKTKFPVARIKRLVQADDEVGKVAQVTPPVVGKALELFMIQMTLAAMAEARGKGSKRLMAVHIKAAIANDDTFDFLRDIGDRIPDGTATKSDGRARKPKHEEPASDEDVDAEAPSSKKRKPGGKRKKPADDDEAY